MPADFVHGAETVEVTDGVKSIQEVRTAIIALVGTAPIHTVDPSVKPAINYPVLVNSEQKKAAFGAELAGYTIPESLAAIFDFGYGTIVCVNVFDPTKHKTAVDEAAATIVAGKVATGKTYISGLVVKKASDSTLRVITTDYTVDPVTGIITITNVDDLAAGSVKIAYDYADVSKVVAADIIGEVDAVIGKKTGLKALKDVESILGFEPKIIIAPGYSSETSVKNEMETITELLRAEGWIDSEVGATLAEVIAARTASGEAFNISSKRLTPCWPRVVVYDSASDGEKVSFFSARLAGARAWKDRNFGYWWSISNTPLKGVLRSEIAVNWVRKDPNCDANLANAAGIITIINRGGLKIWGNRNASYPINKQLDSFECCMRVGDIIEDSIEIFALDYADAPTDRALVDGVVESVNAFLRKRTGSGNPLAGGECRFEPDKNSPDNLALGNIVFDYDMAQYPPAERITLRRRVNVQYLLDALTGGE